METPQFFQGSSYQISPEKRHSDSKTGDHFIIEDLLDFPTDDVVADGGDAVVVDVLAGTPTDTSTVTTAVESCNSDHNFAGDGSFADAQFSNLSVPYDDLAELEWLSNCVEESFSSEDLQKLQLISGMKARPDYVSDTHQFQSDTANRTNNIIFDPDMTVPAKARTKRSRAAPCNWTSRLLSGPQPTMSSESDSVITSGPTGKKSPKTTLKKKEVYENSSHNGDGRKCLHCATDKTPQWRTGPMGPKTLCNACGVRYKSGRLVPEYRPAASPTFVLTKHSNSHRKVLELRRQKEMQMAQHQQQQQQQQQFIQHQNMMFDVSNGDDYLIHQHIGPDYRQLL